VNILAAGVDFSLKQRLTTLAVSGESWTAESDDPGVVESCATAFLVGGDWNHGIL